MIKFNIFTIATLLVLLTIVPSFANSQIELTEPVWDLGQISQGDIVAHTIKIKNSGDDKLIIQKVRASCDCIKVELLNKEAESDQDIRIKAVFDATKEKSREFNKYIYIQSNDKNKPLVRITVKGIITGNVFQENEVPKETVHSQSNSNLEKIEIMLFYNSGCRNCMKVKNVFLPKLIEKYKDKVVVIGYDMNVLENYMTLVKYEDKYGVKESAPIIVFAGDKYFAGKTEIEGKLEDCLKEMILAEQIKKTDIGEIDKEKFFERFKVFSPLLIITAGFLDGINPCAFVTAVFLVSFLFFIEKKRREILLVGFVFALAVFLTYFTIGLGLFRVIHTLSAFTIASKAVCITAVCLVFILSALSLYDAIIYLKSGTSKDMKLQLPLMIKQKIHSVIRNTAGHRWMIFSVFITGVLVAILEGVCTGQVYVPAIYFMIKEQSLKNTGIYYLLLYNLAFIVPLLLVILLTFVGVGMEKIANFSKKNIFWAKMLLGVFFMVLGIVLLSLGCG